MTFQFVAGLACGALLFDLMWRWLFHRWMAIYARQQEHSKWMRSRIFDDDLK